MGANELLLWLSANRAGTWSRFRSAVDELASTQDGGVVGSEGLPVYHRLRFQLQQLGHVEFSAAGCEQGWRVAPPIVALACQDDRCIGILAGARSPTLLRRLVESVSQVQIERHAEIEQPEVIRLIGESEGLLEALAARAGLRVQAQAPVFMLACLPRIDDLGAWRGRQGPLPFGKHTTVSRFEIGGRGARWVDSSVDEAERTRDGLFRFTRFQRRQHYLRLGGRSIRVQGQIGNYILAARHHRQVLRYDRPSRQLTVRDLYRPPLLVDRALALCSGFLPAHDSTARTLSYRDVPERVARMAAGILCQDRL